MLLTDGNGAAEGEEIFVSDTTVFELAGQDKAGLLADITDLLSANDCTVRSAAVRLSTLLRHS